MFTKFDLAWWMNLTSFSPFSRIRVCWIRKRPWYKSGVKIMKPAMVVVSEDRSELTECPLGAKFYAKCVTGIHYPTYLMLEVAIFIWEVIQIWQDLRLLWNESLQKISHALCIFLCFALISKAKPLEPSLPDGSV